MIQRIQTIFLLIAAILMAVTVFSPLAVVTNTENNFSYFDSFGMSTAGEMVSPTWGVLFFVVLGAVLPLINIFLYKKRKMQMKICTVTIIVIIAFYLTFFVYLNSITGLDALQRVQYGIILPAVALVFVLLALSGIKKDEKLIQSLNRIR